MLHFTLRCAALCAALLFLLPAVNAAENAPDTQRFAIDTYRPDSVGETYLYQGTSRRALNILSEAKNSASTSDQDVQTTTLKARVKTLRVDGTRATRIEIEILQMRAHAQGAPPMEMFDPGTKIIAALENGEMTYAAQGITLTEAHKTQFDLFFNLKYEQNGVSDSAIFGCHLPRFDGEKWAVDTALAARILAANGGIVDPNIIHGSVAFEKVKPPSAIPSGTLKAEFYVSSAPLHLKQEGVVKADFDAICSRQSKFPLRPNPAGTYISVSNMRMTVNIRLRDNAGIVRDAKQIIDFSHKSVLTPLK